MFITHKIQKEIYNLLVESNNENIKQLEGIFSSPPINLNFPYLIIDIEKIETEKFCNYLDNYIIHTKIKIFDKNESNKNIMTISNNVLNELFNLVNINVDNFLIVDIVQTNMEINIFNEINSVWNCILNLDIIIKQKK